MAHGNSTRHHIAKADVHRVRCKGLGSRYWYFTFSPFWGPMLTDGWGQPIGQTPLSDEAHPFWDSFEAWVRSLTPPADTAEPLSTKGEGR